MSEGRRRVFADFPRVFASRCAFAVYLFFILSRCAHYGTKTAGELAQLVERVLSMHEVAGFDSDILQMLIE